MKAKICHLAESEIWSQASGALETLGKGVPSNCMFHGKVIPLAWTMYPTKANMAIRPCLISASRRKPMVASSDCPQNSASASSRGSKYPTTGLRSLERDSRSALDSLTATEAREFDAVGANAAALEARRAGRRNFMVKSLFIVYSGRRNYGFVRT